MKQNLLILNRSEIEHLIGLKEAISVIENAFCDFALGNSTIFPVVREKIDPYGGFFGVKAGYLMSQGYLGYKGGGFWKSNSSLNLAAHQSVILLYDPKTGIPLCVMDGNYLTILRTGAVGAVAAKYLARKNSCKVAIIGTGTQGRIQLAGLSEILPLEEVYSFNPNQESNSSFAEYASRIGIQAFPCNTAQEAVRNVDIIVTSTPSFHPIVMDAWVRPSTHINAMGADTKGKQEIDENLLAHSKVVVDVLVQAKELGECQHAFRKQILNSVHAELGEVISGKKPGRESESEITLFDSTGIALQDLAVAAYAYEAALAKSIGTFIQFN